MGKLKNELFGALKTALKPLTQNIIYTYRFGETEFKLKGGLGLARFNKEPSKEELFIDSLNFKDKIVYDIGGYIGIFAIYLGKSVAPNGRVFSFEPNPASVEKIRENLELNQLDNVEVLKIGIADEKKSRTLIVRKHISATGSMEENIQSEILKEKGAEKIQVETDTLDSVITKQKLPEPDFIKVDIEGIEYQALLGMNETLKKLKPELYIEIHGADSELKSKNISQIVGYLEEFDYKIYHVESETYINSENTEIAKEGHIYCT